MREEGREGDAKKTLLRKGLRSERRKRGLIIQISGSARTNERTHERTNSPPAPLNEKHLFLSSIKSVYSVVAAFKSRYCIALQRIHLPLSYGAWGCNLQNIFCSCSEMNVNYGQTAVRVWVFYVTDGTAQQCLVAFCDGRIFSSLL